MSSTPIVDITPTPRILRTLGDIPFEIWQCIAELVDNSLDAFKSAKLNGLTIHDPRIDVVWSSENIPQQQREIIIEDNGPGMDLETLQRAAKAGFSSNDPIGNLGLFGMGFNIATARLGDETVFLSTKKGDSKWLGIKINFDELIKSQSFSAPVVELKKENGEESGTKIIIRRLKTGIFQELKAKERTTRRRLESIYTPILEKKEVSFYLKGKKLDPRPHCVWEKSRYVVRKGEKIYAIQDIDKDLGDAYFHTSKNRYLSEDECADIDVQVSKGMGLAEDIVKRSRRLKGWLGIQRFADPADFGVDFIRNGRKILVSNKEIFGYESEDTGAIVSEYPIELGSTVGGRIVGEIHVDYLIPTYQKNAFDKTDRAWRLTIEAIRGAGPILPKKRSALGYDEDNNSPLGILINAYRRVDPGTKNLAVPNAMSKQWGKRFFAGEIDYLTDDKWYKAAQEADRQKGEGGDGNTPVNTGDAASDDLDDYLSGEESTNPGSSETTKKTSVSGPTVASEPLNSTRNDLISNSTKDSTLSGKYAYSSTPGIDATVWKVSNVQIKLKGVRVPVTSFQDGVELDFFFDPTHPLLSEYPISPKQLLLLALAEKFAIRDPGISAQTAFFGLVDNHLQDERVNTSSLQERAAAILSTIRDRLPFLLGHKVNVCFDLIKASPSDEELLASKLVDEAPHLIDAYQNRTSSANEVLSFIGDRLIISFVREFSDDLLDKKLFDVPFSSINGFPEPTITRLRHQAQEKVINYLRDVSLFLSASKANKNELIRMSNTLTILEGLVV